jgi:diadenylate cyclase
VEMTEDLLRYSMEAAGKVAARAVMVYADVFSNVRELKSYLPEGAAPLVVLATRHRETFQILQKEGLEVLRVPDIQLTRLGQIKIAILLGISQGRFQKGDKLVCLTGISEKKSLDTLLFLEVGEEFELFAGGKLEEIGVQMTPGVFERVLDIAVSLGSEGREGKPVGTIFVMGDTDNVLSQSTPLVLNPFKGHAEEERNILDPGLSETIKEFATIDGAFVIRGDGMVEAAGIYLKPKVPGEKLPWGMGTRHASAAGITASTSAMAICVSASTGNVTVFREGVCRGRTAARRHFAPSGPGPATGLESGFRQLKRSAGSPPPRPASFR